MMKKIIIAIDGPAASGKGSLSRELARALNLAHLDTGSLYRALAYLLKAQNITPHDIAQHNVLPTQLDRDEILKASALPALREEGIGKLASDFSQMTQVRDYLYHLQKNFATHPPEGFNGSVLDGRDIGTIICPDADFKFFVTASAQVRAMRRYKELQSAGEDVTFDAILHKVEARDKADQQRSVAPLTPATDAIVLDSSEMTIEQCLAFCLNIIHNH